MGKANRFLWAILLTCLLTSQAWAYRVIDVKNGGTLQGKAVLVGEMPAQRLFHLILYPNIGMCAEVEIDDEMNRFMNDFVVGPDAGLKDVVITLDYVEAGKPFSSNLDDPIHIHSEHCKFTPDVNVVRQGKAFSIDNVDVAMHNSQVYQSGIGKIILNLSIGPETVITGHFFFQKDYRIFQMICGMHEFMQTWGFRVQNPYHYLTDTDGTFKIDHIPPGDYVVTTWHYLMKPQAQKIHIDPNSVTNIDFTLDGDKVRRSLYETSKIGRFGKEAAKPGTIKYLELQRAKKRLKAKKEERLKTKDKN